MKVQCTIIISPDNRNDKEQDLKTIKKLLNENRITRQEMFEIITKWMNKEISEKMKEEIVLNKVEINDYDFEFSWEKIIPADGYFTILKNKNIAEEQRSIGAEIETIGNGKTENGIPYSVTLKRS